MKVHLCQSHKYILINFISFYNIFKLYYDINLDIYIFDIHVQ